MSTLIGLLLTFLAFMYLIWLLSCWLFNIDIQQHGFWKWLVKGTLLAIFFGSLGD